MNAFYQDGPELSNQYADDVVLRNTLAWRMPAAVFASIEPGLNRLGARVVDDIWQLATSAEAQPPQLTKFDPWGKRIDKIETSDAWNALHRVAAEEAIVATAYEREHGRWSRLHQFARLYLFHPSSAVYSCPLAMTDGAARVLELHGNQAATGQAFSRLTSRRPEQFWTSGQWMTERSGGSDVSGTSTEARWENETFRLYGTKWFTSATTSEMALTLAREPESSELSLFYLETRTPDGELNRIRIHRLKDKLGTRAVPTAELTLEGTPAQRIGEPGKGVRTIAEMLNITRFYNAVCALGGMRRTVALARDYARRRVAFGKRLIEHPAHAETLSELELEYRGAMQLVSHLAVLLGKHELKEATPADHALLRLLTPIAKLYTGKQAVALASEALECFGGAGYVEDTGLPTLLRDAQVLPIWEGTTNVLSLDTLRALAKQRGLETFCTDVDDRLAQVRHTSLARPKQETRNALEQLQGYVQWLATTDGVAEQAGARGFAFSLARTYIASLLLEYAEWCSVNAERSQFDPASVAAAQRWCARGLIRLVKCDATHRQTTRALTKDPEHGLPHS